MSSPALRRLQQGLCALNIVQDGVPGSGPANSVELVTGSTGLDAACVGYLSSTVFCGDVTIRSFYTSPKSDVFAQITTLAPSTGYAVQNGDVVPGASSGLGSFSYGNLTAAPGPGNSATRPWVFARAGGNFTFQGRVIVNTVEQCNGVDDDCDGRTDEGAGCFAGGTACVTTSDCSAGLSCNSGVCGAPGSVGATCATVADCNAGLVCVANLCAVTTCSSGYHVESGACTSDTRSCAIANGTGTQSWTGSAYGACTLLSCNSGYHAAAGACDADVIACATLPANATAGTQTWEGSAYGSCVATACAVGFALSGTSCIAPLPLGSLCTANAECSSGFCSTGAAGTANDRCTPSGMAYIPAGTFTMGSPTAEVGRIAGETQHVVNLTRAFFLGSTEVTQGAWKALSGGTNPSCFQSTSGTTCTTSNANDSGPVETVDWYSAVAFANAKSAAEGLPACYTLTGCADAANGWKDGLHSGCTGATEVGPACTGYRLPTESEWEYAARAGTTTATYLGDLSGTVTDCTTAQANLDGIAWWCRISGSRTQAAAGKTANAWGLYDMLGNVWEWNSDWYGTYPGTVTDPTGAGSASLRVNRGGSWLSFARFARAASRSSDTPGLRNGNLGFRLSRTAP